MVLEIFSDASIRIQIAKRPNIVDRVAVKELKLSYYIGGIYWGTRLC